MKNVKYLARSAVLCSINIIFFVLGQAIRTNSLSFLVLASFVTALALIYTNMQYASLMYAVTSILAFVFIPDKAIVLTYILFFGNYGIIKLFIEKINNIYTQFIVKNAYFVLVFYFLYYLIGDQLINLDALMIKYNFPVSIFLIAFLLLFNVYDLLFSAVIAFLIKKVKIKRD